MKVAALCVQLVVLLQNCYRVQEADAAFVRVDPDRLQFFEYESVSFSCGGSSGWRLMKKMSSKTSQWDTSAGSLDISPAFVSHSGEYFCGNGDGERSGAVNVSVTAGDVVLESPAVPVREGQTVTLRCRKRKTSHNSPADFYKDGTFMETDYSGSLVLHNVSSSSEGLYRCSVPGAGSSPESRLAVSEHVGPKETTPEEDLESSPDFSESGSIHLSILLPAVSVVLFLVLLLLAKLHCRKPRVERSDPEIPTETNPLYDRTAEAEQPTEVYANITGRRKKRVREHADVSEQHTDIYANVTKYKRKRGSGEETATQPRRQHRGQTEAAES